MSQERSSAARTGAVGATPFTALIKYEVIGGSSALPWRTLVHGFSQNRRYFASALPHLQGRFRLLLADLRGHGASASLDGPFGIEEYADDLEAVFAREGVTRTHYWATHTGTAIGLVLALRQPERFETLVLEGAVLPGVAMPRTAGLQARAAMIARSEGVQAAVDDWFEHADWFAYMREHRDETNALGQRRLVAEFAGGPWLSDLEPRPVRDARSLLIGIRGPALVYNGAYDLEEFKAVARTLERHLPEARRVEISNAGGFPLWESPSKVISLVVPFLRQSRLNASAAPDD